MLLLVVAGVLFLPNASGTGENVSAESSNKGVMCGPLKHLAETTCYEVGQADTRCTRAKVLASSECSLRDVDDGNNGQLLTNQLPHSRALLSGPAACTVSVCIAKLRSAENRIQADISTLETKKTGLLREALVVGMSADSETTALPAAAAADSLTTQTDQDAADDSVTKAEEEQSERQQKTMQKTAERESREKASDGSLAPDCILASAAAADCKSELAASNSELAASKSELAASKSELAASNQKFQPTAVPTRAPTATPTSAPTATPTAKKNLAKSNALGGGWLGMPESGIVSANPSGNPNIACPDDLSKGKFFWVEQDGTPHCIAFHHDTFFVSGGITVVKECHNPFCTNNFLGVVTRSQVVPISHTAAAVMLKRVRCEKSQTPEQCDVYKVATCIECSSIKNPCDWDYPWVSMYRTHHGKHLDNPFRGQGAKEWGCKSEHWFKTSALKSSKKLLTQPWVQEGMNWAKHCVEVGVAKNKSGERDPTFMCGDKEKDYFKDVLKGF